MKALATTRMSSKGQVVIPEDVRKRLHLKTGEQFVVVGADDVVILKTIQHPVMDEFDSLIQQARQQAQASGIKKSAIAAAIKSARNRK